MIKLCSLFSGSSGNCIFISSNNTRILLDAGLSGKRIQLALKEIGEEPCNIDAIIISHEHSDHIKGAGILSRRFDIPIYANQNTWRAMESELGQIKSENRMEFNVDNIFNIKDIAIRAFSIPHDASDTVGFNFMAENKMITTATDIGHMNEELIKNLENSELVFLESNHDVEMLKMGSYPYYLKRRILGDYGHLCNDIAGEIAVHLVRKGTKKIVLGHLSHENNFPQLAYKTVYNCLQENNIIVGKEVTLDVALRDRVGQMMEIV